MTIVRTPTKFKGRVKFRSAEDAKPARELERSWSELKAKHAPKKPTSATPLRGKTIRQVLAFQASLDRLPSAPGSRPDPVFESKPFVRGVEGYTGTEVVGLAQMAKSNEVPIMRDNVEFAVDVARMRRG